jgi:hypothetical protein
VGRDGADGESLATASGIVGSDNRRGKKIQPIPIPQHRRKRWSLELGIRDEGDQHHEQKGQENQKPFHSDDQLIHLTFFLDHRGKFFRRERRAASGA